MSYVVKKECYLDEHGNGRPSSIHAKKHDDYEMAKAVAITCGGRVVELIDKTDRKVIRTKIEPKKKKVSKANQAWMRKGYSDGE